MNTEAVEHRFASGVHQSHPSPIVRPPCSHVDQLRATGVGFTSRDRVGVDSTPPPCHNSPLTALPVRDLASGTGGQRRESGPSLDIGSSDAQRLGDRGWGQSGLGGWRNAVCLASSMVTSELWLWSHPTVRRGLWSHPTVRRESGRGAWYAEGDRSGHLSGILGWRTIRPMACFVSVRTVFES